MKDLEQKEGERSKLVIIVFNDSTTSDDKAVDSDAAEEKDEENFNSTYENLINSIKNKHPDKDIFPIHINKNDQSNDHLEKKRKFEMLHLVNQTDTIVICGHHNKGKNYICSDDKGTKLNIDTLAKILFYCIDSDKSRGIRQKKDYHPDLAAPERKLLISLMICYGADSITDEDGKTTSFGEQLASKLHNPEGDYFLDVNVRSRFGFTMPLSTAPRAFNIGIFILYELLTYRSWHRTKTMLEWALGKPQAGFTVQQVTNYGWSLFDTRKSYQAITYASRTSDRQVVSITTTDEREMKAHRHGG